MATPVKRMTIAEFDAWVDEPAQRDKIFQYIGGEIVEVGSNPYSSEIAIEISFHIKLYLRENDIQGHVTGADGGYKVGGERYIPDVGYLAKSKQDKMPYNQGYNNIAPDLAVEVISPSDTDRQITIKTANYLAEGTVVWNVYPETKEVAIFEPNKIVQVLGIEDEVDGGAVLPNFKLAVKDIFAE